MQAEREPLWTPEEVAEYLRVRPLAVYRWLREGRLHGLKVGRLWRIRQSDLDAFLDGRSSTTNPEQTSRRSRRTRRTKRPR